MQVTVLGMGNMGRALALRLLDQGHQVVVWNRSPGKAGEVTAAGGTEVGSPDEAVRGSAAVFLSLANDDAVKAVALDASVIGALGDEAVLVDTSTVAPSTTRQVAGATPGNRMVASPILGAPPAVRSGRATYLVAGPSDHVRHLDDLWSALTESRRELGEDPGTATTVKLLANYLLMAGVAVLSEAVATGQHLGLADDLLRDVFSSIPVVAPALLNRLDDIIDGDHEGWFSAVLGAKDVRLAGSLARQAGIELPVADVVLRRYEALEQRGLGEADIAAVVELLR